MTPDDECNLHNGSCQGLLHLHAMLLCCHDWSKGNHSMFPDLQLGTKRCSLSAGLTWCSGQGLAVLFVTVIFWCLLCRGGSRVIATHASGPKPLLWAGDQ